MSNRKIEGKLFFPLRKLTVVTDIVSKVELYGGISAGLLEYSSNPV